MNWYDYHPFPRTQPHTAYARGREEVRRECRAGTPYEISMYMPQPLLSCWQAPPASLGDVVGDSGEVLRKPALGRSGKWQCSRYEQVIAAWISLSRKTNLPGMSVGDPYNVMQQMNYSCQVRVQAPASLRHLSLLASELVIQVDEIGR